MTLKGLSVDHDGKQVLIVMSVPPDISVAVSYSPAEAKAVAAALVHYAERAQKVRDEGDGSISSLRWSDAAL